MPSLIKVKKQKQHSSIMAAINRHYRKKPQLNLTPLIDVIFLLIVFFMLTSKFSLDKVIDAGLAPVSSASKKEEVNSDTVLVMLQENGDFKLWSRSSRPLSRTRSGSIDSVMGWVIVRCILLLNYGNL